MRQGIKSLLGPKLLLGIAIAYTLLVTAALLTPITGAPKIVIPFADKMVHLIINAGLFMVWASYVFSGKTNTKTTKTYARQTLEKDPSLILPKNSAIKNTYGQIAKYRNIWNYIS